ncbi:helix-turn-helix domain-containing protein [Ferruginibacter albus]|uniref:helix-turn-helix domain-containing protein n=1 Tax=Ferruginibacter albus TaxID=2875540 RepID=UPI001CC70848|nr:helix-turn-helix transcriptional regulator [Ferruginibacter albus]UAY52744.1 helix-turn-helix domain-containing protein [Ferruginibacter albus]
MKQQKLMREEDFLIALGKNITKYRKKKGLTSKELGFMCDMEKSNLIPIEKGRINTTALTLLKIANALEVGVKDFFDFT